MLTSSSDRVLQVVCVACAVLYPTVRYVLVGAVPASDLPLFVANKALAFYAALALAVAAWRRARGASESAASWRRALLATTMLHVLLSLVLLAPAYFPRFYTPDLRFTAEAGVALLVGTVALLAWWGGPLRRRLDPRRTLTVGALLMVVHVGAIGLAVWRDPASWPGSLPPITLITAALGLAAALVPGRRGPGPSAGDGSR